MIRRLCLLSLVVGSGASATTAAGSLEPDRHHRPIARREAPPRSTSRAEILLGAAGELVDTSAQKHTQANDTDGNATSGSTSGSSGNATSEVVRGFSSNVTLPHNPEDPDEKPEREGSMKMCNFDYVQGVADKLVCKKNQSETLIFDPSVCLDAANVTGTKVLAMVDFLIKHEDYSKYPRGCFEKPCTAGGSEQCIFFNDNDESLTRKVEDFDQGTPLCTRDKFFNGTVNSSECYDVYQLITKDTECSDAAACMGWRYADPPRIDEDESNYKQYNFFPKGCFVNWEDNQVYYNEHQATAPTKPVGTPICVVATSLPVF